MSEDDRVELPDSEHPSLPSGVIVHGPVDPDEVITTTVFVRRKAAIPESLTTTCATISEDEFADLYGADPADIERVRQAVAAAGAEVISASELSCRIKVRGDAAALSALFGAQIQNMSSPSPHTGLMLMHRAVEGALSVPGSLDGVVTAVMGLDERPLFKRAGTPATLRSDEVVPQGWTVSVAQLVEAYQFPLATGAGCRIAILEFDGGFLQSDLDAYFANLGMSPPSVTIKSVDNAQNNPGVDLPSNSDLETTFDIQVASALAPGAAIEVYFAPNTAQSYVDAYWSVFTPPHPTVCSMSWDFRENHVSAAHLNAMNDALETLAAFNVTHINSSGDWGSAGVQDGTSAEVCYPASSPFTLAVGGTELRTTDSGTTVSEIVWNTLDGPRPGASGGGYSTIYCTPAWQAPVAHGRMFRGVPDVAAMASSNSLYEGWLRGSKQVGYGTSFATPLWAALLCRIAELLGRQAGMGFINTHIYPSTTEQSSLPGFRDITDGNNGIYTAGHGWDPCTGLGVPHGIELLEHLRTRLQAVPAPRAGPNTIPITGKPAEGEHH